MSYDDSFYEMINKGSRESAEVVVPLVLQTLEQGIGRKSFTVIDVGCGQGVWTKAFANAGCEVTGVDGHYVDRNKLAIPTANFHSWNLDSAFSLNSDAVFNTHLLGKYDLAVSLEVAEHLPETRAAGFVEDLCGLADVILFSAALPGQGGVGHANEQWPAYWQGLFDSNGFSMTGSLRWGIWDNDKVENWYRQNLMLCVRKELEENFIEFQHPVSEPIPVVHPVLWNHIRFGV